MKNRYELVLNRAKISPEDFDQDGLRWPTHVLEFIANEALFYPLVDLLQYVDQVVFNVVCKDHPDEIELLSNNIDRVLAKPSLEGINTTSLGNLAFVATFCSNKKVATKAFNAICKLRLAAVEDLQAQAGRVVPAKASKIFKPTAEA